MICSYAVPDITVWISKGIRNYSRSCVFFLTHLTDKFWLASMCSGDTKKMRPKCQLEHPLFYVHIGQKHWIVDISKWMGQSISLSMFLSFFCNTQGWWVSYAVMNPARSMPYGSSICAYVCSHLCFLDACRWSVAGSPDRKSSPIQLCPSTIHAMNPLRTTVSPLAAMWEGVILTPGHGRKKRPPLDLQAFV